MIVFRNFCRKADSLNELLLVCVCRSTLQRTRSEPIPLPVQLLLQQHKMLLNKQQDQQLKENHKLYLKKVQRWYNM